MLTSLMYVLSACGQAMPRAAAKAQRCLREFAELASLMCSCAFCVWAGHAHVPLFVLAACGQAMPRAAAEAQRCPLEFAKLPYVMFLLVAIYRQL